MSLLEVKNLNVFYGDVQVIWDASFHVEEGEIISMIGANGAGKSTMLKTISGIMEAASGEIIFEGEPIQELPPEKVVDKGVIQVPEGRKLFPLMTIKENLEMGAYNARGTENYAQNLELVHQLLPRLKEREQQQAITLSGGEQQMVAVGRGIMASPKLLMLDEPSLGLAPVLIQEIFETIKKIADQGMTVLLVEQDVQNSLGMSDRGYVMEHGRMLMEGKADELLNNPQIREAYLGI